MILIAARFLRAVSVKKKKLQLVTSLAVKMVHKERWVGDSDNYIMKCLQLHSYVSFNVLTSTKLDEPPFVYSTTADTLTEKRSKDIRYVR